MRKIIFHLGNKLIKREDIFLTFFSIFLAVEYLHAGDYNILAVDWSKLASWDNYAGKDI
jgi:hypothetical protein